ncbi:hypothetical protein [Bacteroides sp. 51]|uniref:IS66 family insertion sequence element accessory protein TnpA n=1 Tax=Bacteroides sp. 51 TaxID=2302938 RepID=UPI0013D041B7|nr:hypothetical protein [Bacteroides sp. 51]
MWNFQEFTDTYARFRSSGLTIRDFCSNERINEAKFYYWQKKLKSAESAPVTPSGFLPLALQPCSSVNPQVDHSLLTQNTVKEAFCEIIYPNGVKLHLPANADLRLLRSLIFLSE